MAETFREERYKTRLKNLRTVESQILATAPAGLVFYSEKTDKEITSQAFHHNRKTKTERGIFVTTGKETPTVIKCVRVTIIL